MQYHPESSPGPHDSRYLFKAFKSMIENRMNGVDALKSGDVLKEELKRTAEILAGE